MSGHALVTGSSGGIGSAVCTRLTAEGWSVTGLDLEPAPSSAAWAHVGVDLADPAGLPDAVEASRRANGPATAIVHCAARQILGAAGTNAAAEWQQILQVNVVALDLLVAAVRSDLIDACGAIVAISSVHAAATTPGIAVYATSKAALNGWVRAAALDLAPDVRVNAIQPGAVRTAMLVDGLSRRPHESPDASLRELALRTPMQRVAEPADIAALTATLLDGERTGFVTGAVVTADGGALVHLSTE